MISLKISEILKVTDGHLINSYSNQTVGGISTDSRKIKEGDLFIPLRGENFNGETFIKDALKRGASGFIKQRSAKSVDVSSKQLSVKGKIVIEVNNTLKALQDIAGYILRQVNPKVIAITGSTGKTSVKDLLKSVLSLEFKTVASQDNYNNEIGLPLTLLRLKPQTEVVILEMGMRGLGQIEELTKIAPPDFALITNIGKTHIELLADEKNILRAKAEVIKGLKAGGTLFLNNDDPSTKRLLSMITVDSVKLAQTCQEPIGIVLFGKNKAIVNYSNLSFDDFVRPSFKLAYQDKKIDINLQIVGRQAVINATAAAAIALTLEMSLKKIKQGLEQSKLSAGRMGVCKANGWLILDDSYNASPVSMEAALNTLSSIKAKRKVAILGDMLELGDFAEEEHLKLGGLAANSDIDTLLTVGNCAKSIAKGAIKAGFAKDNINSFRDVAAIKKEIISYLRQGDVILIKASRVIKLDELACYLQKKR